MRVAQLSLVASLVAALSLSACGGEGPAKDPSSPVYASSTGGLTPPSPESELPSSSSGGDGTVAPLPSGN